MKLQEFINKYCQHILEKRKEMENNGLVHRDYDREIFDDNGDLIKVLDVGDYTIPVDDVFDLPDEDYEKRYPGQEAAEARRLYLKGFVVIEGEELLHEIENSVRKTTTKINEYAQMFKEFIYDTNKLDKKGSDDFGGLFD